MPFYGTQIRMYARESFLTSCSKKNLSPYELERIRNELKSELTLVQLLEDNQIMNEFDWFDKL